jgi:hypothetical protein
MTRKAGRILLTCMVLVTWLAATLAADDKARKFPDVVSAKVRASGDNKFDFDVTLSSPYDTPQRYADAFRVMSADGKVYGERKLLHDHAGEQPFTPDLYGVTIPPHVNSVVIQARDQKYGYDGKTLKISLPGR